MNKRIFGQTTPSAVRELCQYISKTYPVVGKDEIIDISKDNLPSNVKNAMPVLNVLLKDTKEGKSLADVLDALKYIKTILIWETTDDNGKKTFNLEFKQNPEAMLHATRADLEKAIATLNK